MRISRPALEYIVTSSKASLESFELMRLSRVTNLRKELREVINDWVESEVEARFARFTLEQRRAQDGDRRGLVSRRLMLASSGFFVTPSLQPVCDFEEFSEHALFLPDAANPSGEPELSNADANAGKPRAMQMELFAAAGDRTSPRGQLLRLLNAASFASRSQLKPQRLRLPMQSTRGLRRIARGKFLLPEGGALAKVPLVAPSEPVPGGRAGHAPEVLARLRIRAYTTPRLSRNGTPHPGQRAMRFSGISDSPPSPVGRNQKVSEAASARKFPDNAELRLLPHSHHRRADRTVAATACDSLPATRAVAFARM